MAYIYKITNQINGKIYIGKTLKDISSRWKEHCRTAKKACCEKRPLYMAINKYGIENFKIEQVEECADTILNEREQYWIDYYHSFKTGYNMTKGGDGKPYLDYDLIMQLWNQGLTIKQIHNQTHYDEGSISKVLKNRGIDASIIQKRAHCCHSHKIEMLDIKTGQVIIIFDSLAEAERYLGKARGSAHIREVCLGIRQTAYGHKWRYVNELDAS